jgi:hypothetical protein
MIENKIVSPNKPQKTNLQICVGSIQNNHSPSFSRVLRPASGGSMIWGLSCINFSHKSTQKNAKDFFFFPLCLITLTF